MSADDTPIIERLPGHDNVIVATGHGANGLLLGPVTGAIVADLCTGATLNIDLTPFAPDRFG